jgi:hypothetical protein
MKLYNVRIKFHEELWIGSKIIRDDIDTRNMSTLTSVMLNNFMNRYKLFLINVLLVFFQKYIWQTKKVLHVIPELDGVVRKSQGYTW